MAAFYMLLATATVGLGAALPAEPRLYPPPPHATSHLQKGNLLEYYLDNQRQEADYFRMNGDKSANVNNEQMNKASHLENLEPDSEVELIPGAQQPQQPPQQNPVTPNIPGLLPGQRVFIVHMPVPGYTPGTIAGYQPVYVVGAQGNNSPYPGGAGYQNNILVDPSRQSVGTPFVVHGGAPGSHLLISPFQRPYDFIYPNADSEPVVGIIKTGANADPIRFANNARLQSPLHRLVYVKQVDQLEDDTTKKVANVSNAARLKQDSDDTKKSIAQKHKQ